jgi:phage repressor protein C with HTH and peptisase S24 domain
VGWPLRVVLVRGPSMVPALRDGDHLLVWLGRRRSRVGRIILVELPDGRPLSVKRLSGVDVDGRVRVTGDNDLASTDSRSFGALPADSIRGVVLLRLWPKPGVPPSRR